MEISSVEDLRKFAAYVRAGGETAGKTFKFTANLNLSGIANWTPIEIFNGTFDGGGKTIRSLTVKNLTLKNVSVSANYYVGGLADGAVDSVVENVTIIGVAAVGASKFNAGDDTGATKIFKIADNCSGLGGVEIFGEIIEFGGSKFAAAGFDTADIIGAEKITVSIFKFTVGAEDCQPKLQGRKILGGYEFVVDGNIYVIDGVDDYF